MKTRTRDHTMSKSNRADLYATITVGLIVAVITIITATLRIVHVLPNTNVSVLVPLADTTTSLPLGPDGADVTVAIDQAAVTVSNMPPVVVASLVLSAICGALTVLIVTALICLLCRNMLGGTMFSRVNSRLVWGSSVTIATGWLLGLLLNTMGTNGAVATLSDNSFDKVVMTIDWLPFVFAMMVGALALAFRAGERMQRDTDGLV